MDSIAKLLKVLQLQAEVAIIHCQASKDLVSGLGQFQSQLSSPGTGLQPHWVYKTYFFFPEALLSALLPTRGERQTPKQRGHTDQSST